MKKTTEGNPVAFTNVTSIVVDDEVYTNTIQYTIQYFDHICDLVPFTTLQENISLQFPQPTMW